VAVAVNFLQQLMQILTNFYIFLHHIFYERDAAHWLYCVLQFASVPYWQHALGVAGFDEYQLVMLLM